MRSKALSVQKAVEPSTEKKSDNNVPTKPVRDKAASERSPVASPPFPYT